MYITAYDLALRWIGTKEVAGVASNDFIRGMLRLDATWPTGDEVPWCSAFVNFICWQLRLPRSKSLAARSWLQVGTPVELTNAVVGFDVVILKRGSDPNAGHVGFFASLDEGESIVQLLGGNQSDAVTVAPFPRDRVVGVRRLSQEG